MIGYSLEQRLLLVVFVVRSPILWGAKRDRFCGLNKTTFGVECDRTQIHELLNVNHTILHTDNSSEYFGLCSVTYCYLAEHLP